MQSPGFVYEPYEPRERISFWKRYDFFNYKILVFYNYLYCYI